MKTFQNYYYEKETKNALAVYALRQLAQNDRSEISGNSIILLTGLSGTGKSHILTALHNEANKNGVNSAYYRLNDFIDEFVRTIRANKPDEFYNKPKSKSLLIFDDIEQIINKEGIQVELYKLVEYFIAEGKTIIFSAISKSAVKKLNSPLTEKLYHALHFELSEPGDESVLRYIADYETREEFTLMPGMAEYALKKFGKNIPVLHAALVFFKLIARMKGVESIDFASVENYL